MFVLTSVIKWKAPKAMAQKKKNVSSKEGCFPFDDTSRQVSFCLRYLLKKDGTTLWFDLRR